MEIERLMNGGTRRIFCFSLIPLSLTDFLDRRPILKFWVMGTLRFAISSKITY